MTEILTLLVPRALPIVTKGGVLEAAVIRSRASKSDAPFAAKIAKSLALRNKSRRWNAGCGQQKIMYGSRRFVKKFMCEEMAVKICL